MLSVAAEDPQKLAGIRFRQSKLDALKAIADVERTSMADLVDRALDAFIKSYGPIPKMPQPKLKAKK
jgi:hypothetical protein